MENFKQTTLDEYCNYSCPRCGAKFNTIIGLRIHIAHHERHDRFTIINTLNYIKNTPSIFRPSQLKAILKAIISKTKDEAISALSIDKDLQDLVEAIKFSYDFWEIQRKNFIEMVMSEEDIIELINISLNNEDTQTVMNYIS